MRATMWAPCMRPVGGRALACTLKAIGVESPFCVKSLLVLGHAASQKNNIQLPRGSGPKACAHAQYCISGDIA